MGVVVDPRFPCNPIGYTTVRLPKVPAVLGQEHKRLVEDVSLDCTLLTISSVVRIGTWLSVRLFYRSSQRIKKIHHVAERPNGKAGTVSLMPNHASSASSFLTPSAISLSRRLSSAMMSTGES